jgi:HAMP domain-containing protein
MSEDTGLKLVKLIVLCMVMQLFLIGYVFATGYHGRQDTVQNQRAACERGKLDRKVNAQGWRIAEEARRADGQEVVAQAYNNIASSLEDRADINCEEVFPDARIIP